MVDVLLRVRQFARKTLVVFDDSTRTITVSVMVGDEDVYREFKRLYEAIRAVVR